jgi:hypothetical protein
MSENKGRDVMLSSDSNQMPDVFSADTAAHRQEVIQAIEDYTEKLNNRKLGRNGIKSRLKLLQMRDRVNNGDSLTAIEKQLWEMAIDIEEPSLRIQRKVAYVIIFYTLFALTTFMLITFSDAIILPSFNIPYSVLMMGLVGCLVSMYVKLPNIRARKPVSHDSILWFVISPPIAVIMAGIIFGVIQILLPLLQVSISDESWFIWIMAWLVGFVNWVSLYDRLSLKIRSRFSNADAEHGENVYVFEDR